MVQERDLEPRKFHEADFDAAQLPQRQRRISPPSPVPPQTPSSSPATDVASGLALLLSLIAFFFSSYAVIQAVAARREALRTPASVAPTQSNPASGSTSATPVSRPLLPLLAPNRAQSVEPGRYVQPIYNGAGEIELLSATRANRDSNVATVRFQVRRLNNSLQGLGDIDLRKTIALNTRTNEQFPAIQFQTPGDELLSLSNLRPGQSVNASVTLRVPERLDRIDLEIPQARVFRNVPIQTS